MTDFQQFYHEAYHEGYRDGQRATQEALINSVRRVHNPGDEGRLAPGKWCVADGEEWPCKTMKALNQVVK